MSYQWKMQVVDFGDMLFAELGLLKAPMWDGQTDGVELVFVATREQYDKAIRTFRDSRIVQVVHQGYKWRAPVPEKLHHAVCFSRLNSNQLSDSYPSASILPILPYFEPKGIWKWKANDCWTVMSRPARRQPVAAMGVHQVLFLTANRVKHAWHGEGQDGGFLDKAQMAAKQRSCSCYLSVLPPKSGVGLTEHECMASGVPIVGSLFGDIRACFLRESPRKYLLLYDYWEFEDMTDSLIACCHDPKVAKLASEASLQYIRDYAHFQRMEASIAEVLDKF